MIDYTPLLAPVPLEDEGAGWFIVGYDPRTFRYYEESQEAADSTNYLAILDALDDDEMATGWELDGTLTLTDGDWCEVGYRSSWRNVADCTYLPIAAPSFPAYQYSSFLIVRKGSESWEILESLAKSLSNYPLLDEEGYSELEFAAWERYWFEDAQWSSRCVLDARDFDWHTLIPTSSLPSSLDDDDTYDLLVDYCSSDRGKAVGMQGMGHWHGFTGEHDDRGCRDAWGEDLAAAWRLFQHLATHGHHAHLVAMGHRRLPFPS